ncbi:MAG: hypothetical protein J6V25_10965 [Oscillospiraceae bacterium]|nr:hypothetical protein [Oscillospiraceae bacterium]
MSEPIKFREIKLEGGWLMIRPEYEDMGQAMAFVRKFKQGKLYSVTMNLLRKKRSLDANQMLWGLIHKMSAILKLPPEEIYQGYIPDVGDNYRIVPVKPEDYNQFAADWCHNHIGRMVEDMGPCRKRDLMGYHNIICYRGSSEYDTATFSRLLNLVIHDCESLGIPVMDDRERSLLLDEWEATRNA